MRMPGIDVSNSAAGLLHTIAVETHDEVVDDMRRRICDVLEDETVCDALGALAFTLATIIMQKVPDDEQQTAVLEAFPYLVQAMMSSMAE